MMMQAIRQDWDGDLIQGNTHIRDCRGGRYHLSRLQTGAVYRVSQAVDDVDMVTVVTEGIFLLLRREGENRH